MFKTLILFTALSLSFPLFSAEVEMASQPASDSQLEELWSELRFESTFQDRFAQTLGSTFGFVDYDKSSDDWNKWKATLYFYFPTVVEYHPEAVIDKVKKVFKVSLTNEQTEAYFNGKLQVRIRLGISEHGPKGKRFKRANYIRSEINSYPDKMALKFYYGETSDPDGSYTHKSYPTEADFIVVDPEPVEPETLIERYGIVFDKLSAIK